MTITRHRAVNVRSRSGRTGRVARPVCCGVPGNDCVFQSYGPGTNADAAAGTLSNGTWRQAGSSLIDAAVAGLSIVTTNR
jgi:hypothetical protein